MSKIEEIRSQVLSETDTAQQSLESFLDKLDSTNTTELRFDLPFHGDLDFSVLKDRGFKKVETIIFENEGEITSIMNIPEGIRELSVNNQLIISIDKLPDSIETLSVSDNHITKFDASMVPKLHTLNISNNELTELTNLPETLKILNCENNQLRRLNLAGTPKLHNLVASNNPILVLEHVPSSLVNLEMENNPFVEIDRSEPSRKGTKRQNTIFNYRESLNEYFRLKNMYETKSIKLKRAAYNNGISKKDSIKRARMVKPPCISCGRKVGTLFTHVNGNYRAICGDHLSNQCKLDIHIISGNFSRFDELFTIYNEDIQDNKQTIIEQKMNTLFKYISEETSAKQFKEELEQYNSTSDMHKKMLDKYDDIYNNVERKTQLSKYTQHMYRIREDIEKILDEYKKSGNRELLITAMDMYVKDLVPKIQQIRLTKYDTIYVEPISEDPPVTRLVTNEISTYSKDVIFGGDESKVVRFVIE
jgi:hypothetical protein